MDEFIPRWNKKEQYREWMKEINILSNMADFMNLDFLLDIYFS
jgi:hypothetical protein